MLDTLRGYLGGGIERLGGGGLRERWRGGGGKLGRGGLRV